MQIVYHVEQKKTMYFIILQKWNKKCSLYEYEPKNIPFFGI